MLVPDRKGQEIDEKLILLCLYNLGLEKFIQILPDESKEILRKLLDKEGDNHIPL
ncbi:hypothetical protein [Lentibacillus cibarius]|uniref:hypothetical protein n=1 Tax=Lentibacillus cibarius TaxID=2583219 RepID=UPI00163DB93D|nr:hypothetical protein [Lentibacillus cibarius]